MYALHIPVLIVLTGLLIWAGVSDARRFEIPNRISLGLVTLFPVYLAATPDPIHPLPSLLLAVFVFVIGAALFAGGFIGGGDVKLFAAVTLWVGPAGFTPFLLRTAILGGVLGGILLTRPGAALAQRVMAPGTLIDGSAAAMRRPVPYGIAIALAGLWGLLLPQPQ
jgi:prepilin peptidase CpaA